MGAQSGLGAAARSQQKEPSGPHHTHPWDGQRGFQRLHQPTAGGAGTSVFGKVDKLQGHTGEGSRGSQPQGLQAGEATPPMPRDPGAHTVVLLRGAGLVK